MTSADDHLERQERLKKDLRHRIRVARRARSGPERQRHAADLARTVMALPEIHAATTVTCYVSFPTEPGTGPLRRSLQNAGIRVLLPVTLPAGHLDWVLDPGPDPDGNDRPAAPPDCAGPPLGPTAIAAAEVLLLPALAVDRLGHRLGQGGGYYDRALPLASPHVPAVALLHPDEYLRHELVPCLPHDKPVDVVALPGRSVRLARPGRNTGLSSAQVPASGSSSKPSAQPPR